MDGYESIGICAFISCSELNSVNIPSSVKSIGSGAFQNCKNLKNIDIDTQNEYFILEKGALKAKSSRDLLSDRIEEPGTKRGFIISLIITIIIAAALLIGNMALFIEVSSHDEDYTPFMGSAVAIIGAILIYIRLKNKYDKKIAIPIGITFFIVFSLLSILLFHYSYFAAMILDVILLSLIFVSIVVYIILKNFDITSEEYNKLK